MYCGKKLFLSFVWHQPQYAMSARVKVSITSPLSPDTRHVWGGGAVYNYSYYSPPSWPVLGIQRRREDADLSSVCNNMGNCRCLGVTSWLLISSVPCTAPKSKYHISNIVSFICWTRTQCYNLRQQLILFLGLVESHEVFLFEHSSINFQMRKVFGLCMLWL